MEEQKAQTVNQSKQEDPFAGVTVTSQQTTTATQDQTPEEESSTLKISPDSIPQQEKIRPLQQPVSFPTQQFPVLDPFAQQQFQSLQFPQQQQQQFQPSQFPQPQQFQPSQFPQPQQFQPGFNSFGGGGGYISNPFTVNSHYQQPYQQPYQVKRGPQESQEPSKFDDDDLIDEKGLNKKLDAKTLGSKQDIPTTSGEIFDISFKLKYKTLQLNSASTTIEPALFTLKTSSDVESARAPLDLVCVIDTSGSMDGEKIELVRSTLTYLLSLLGDDDRISIVKFEGYSKRLTPLLRVTDTNKPKLQEAIDILEGGGGTDIAEGIRKAFQVLNQRRCRNTVSSIFLLSDGLDGGALSKIESLLKADEPKDTFTIHSFGYGKDHDPKLMSSIAKLKDGNFYFIEKLETVDECFVDAIGGLISVIGDTTITIQTVKSDVFPNVEIKKAFGGADLWKVVDGSYNTGITQLPSGKSKNYILELAIPKCNKPVTDQQKEIVIAKALVTIKLAKNDEICKKECELKVNLVNEDEELPLQTADKDLLNNYYRVRSSEVMTEARKLAESGKYEDGRKLLQNFKEELSKSAVKDEPMVVGLLSDLETTITEMQPRVFEQVGVHRLYQQATSHMEERSNPYSMNSAGLYANFAQQQMVQQVQASKKTF